MMKQFRWLNIFLIILSIMTLTCALTIFALKQYVRFLELLTYRVYKVPFYIYLGGILLFLSMILASFLYYGLKYSQRGLVQKLHWLVVGNYHHAIFSESHQKRGMIATYSNVLDEQINTLAHKMQMLSENMKIWTDTHTPISEEERSTILEEERHRIARELHDSVSQQLFAAMMMLSAVNQLTKDQSDALKNQLNMIEYTINEAQKEMRALLLHLRPVKLGDKSLSQGVMYLLEELDSKMNITIVSDIQSVHVSTLVEDHLFRIVQELLSNVLRHAKATTLEVYLYENKQHIHLRVVDNGVGFDTNTLKMSSYGLSNIKERIAGLGGTVKIVSVKNQGTVIDIKI
ncbi:sensor histidine kinase [Carnobacteriaceae bacterium zg-84]|uniref:sensor histidine kinase n=1 Tax=Granulicatella sp. zg-84 TaxID=2678503 RepID=UPI0013BF070E|nr:sensor histidine kinase [Granulicatella sp. zg-84]NEW66411.1 sensor histidine kinase [Granulicatella sp. zg-84]QMI86121.1 sensor histidine kinase [Carnobacteriaceae bacterium zg-84]